MLLLICSRSLLQPFFLCNSYTLLCRLVYQEFVDNPFATPNSTGGGHSPDKGATKRSIKEISEPASKICVNLRTKIYLIELFAVFAPFARNTLRTPPAVSFYNLFKLPGNIHSGRSNYSNFSFIRKLNRVKCLMPW